jgi:hypothetical protein
MLRRHAAFAKFFEYTVKRYFLPNRFITPDFWNMNSYLRNRGALRLAPSAGEQAIQPLLGIFNPRAELGVTVFPEFEEALVEVDGFILLAQALVNLGAAHE